MMKKERRQLQQMSGTWKENHGRRNDKGKGGRQGMDGGTKKKKKFTRRVKMNGMS